MTEQKIAQIFEQVGLAKIVRELANDELMNAVQSAMIAIAQEQPSLPSKLDEAANDYCSAYFDWDNEGERSAVVSTFKAGAEWMAGQFEKNHLDALSKVKALRDAQNAHAKTMEYGLRNQAIRLGKEVDEMLDKLKIK